MSGPKKWTQYPENFLTLITLKDDELPRSFPTETLAQAKALRLYLHNWKSALERDPTMLYAYTRIAEYEFKVENTLTGPALTVNLRKRKMLFRALDSVTQNPQYIERMETAQNELMDLVAGTAHITIKPNIDASEKLLESMGYGQNTTQTQTQTEAPEPQKTPEQLEAEAEAERARQKRLNDALIEFKAKKLAERRALAAQTAQVDARIQTLSEQNPNGTQKPD